MRCRNRSRETCCCRPHDTDKGAPPERPAPERPNKRLYRVEEVVPLINIGRTKVYEQIRLGRLKSVTIGNRRLIPIECVQEFIELLKRESEADGSWPST
jgi:excisionase family DNA binding protein